MGTEESSTKRIRKMVSEESVPEAIRTSVETAYNNYLIVGGMPAAVSEFAESNDYAKVWKIHSEILEYARGDVMKYAPRKLKLKILSCFDSIPRILAKENKTFMYSEIEGPTGYGDREYGQAIDWIEAAGLVHRCRNLSDVCEPLKQHEREDSFKIYMSDQGLLTHMLGMETAQALSRGDVFVNRGAIMESAAAQALLTSGFQIHFYSKRNSMLETDFIISYKGMTTAIEMKSGIDKRSKSLRMLLSGNYKISRGIKIASCETGTDENGIVHLPLFAPSFFEQSETVTIETPDMDEINRMLKE